MVKLILALIVVAGAYFLTNAYCPSLWASGPGFLSFKTFSFSWGHVVLVGCLGLFLRYKGK